MSEYHGATHDEGFGGTSGIKASAGCTPTEPDIDAAIDAVARDMTSLEPPSAFRAAVMTRVRLQTTPHGSGWWVLTKPRGAWAAAVVVLVLMVASGVWIGRSGIQPAPGNIASLTVAPSSPSEPAVGPALASDDLAADATRETGSLAQSAQVRPRTARLITAARVRPAGDGVTIVPALTELEPLQFAHIGLDALDVPAVEVAPLSAIPSLDIPSLHTESTDTRSTNPMKEN